MLCRKDRSYHADLSLRYEIALQSGKALAHNQSMSSDEGAVTPLAVWMREKRVSGAEFARRSGMNEQAVSRIRRGFNRPTDEQKLAVARTTLEIEIELKLAEPRGVPVLDWFEGLEAPTPAQAAG